MAAELIDKLVRVQTNLLADEHSQECKIIPKDAIESLVESFSGELDMHVMFVCDLFIGTIRYNIDKGEWEEGPVIPLFRREGHALIGVKALQNRQLGLVFESGKRIIVDPYDPTKPRTFDYIGSSGYHPDYDLRGEYDDDRPEFHAVVSMGPDRVALLDNILRHNYLETNLRTDSVDVYEIGGQYREPEEEEEEDLPENGGYRRFAHSYHELYDVGFGRCLLVADAEDDPPFPRAYILLHAGTDTLRTLPAPYTDIEIEYYDYCVGMDDGSIFMVGGTIFEGNRYVNTARCSKFDIVTGAWIRLADAPVPIDTSLLVKLPNGDIMVVTQTEGTEEKMMIYNPVSNTWKMTTSRFSDIENGSYLVVV